jgi:hypothetical protein
MLLKKTIFTLGLVNQITEVLPPEAYCQRLGTLRSNSIGEQLWCLAGARESYFTAIVKDARFQWICSFKSNPSSKIDMDAYLLEWSQKYSSLLSGLESLSENQQSLLLDLIAHEYQHQGQLIRYLYGNQFRLPDGWQKFWHLEQ